MKKQTLNFKIILTFVILIFSAQTWAEAGGEVGFFFGMKNATFKSDADLAPDFNSKSGIMAGIIGTRDLGGVTMRAGGYYTTRATEVDAGSGVTADLEAASLDVPVTAVFKVNDMLGLFGGATLALNISDDCSGSALICGSDTAKKIESFHVAATGGLTATFHPNWSGEIFYEYGLTEFSKDTKVNSLSAAVIFIY